MKHYNLPIVLIFIFFNISLCSNLFFKWRMTDIEKKQFEKEMFELIKSNVELYNKFVSNYLTKTENSDEPILRLSRYTHCQKCLNFVKSFRSIKEKYGGFGQLIKNLKEQMCPVIKNMFDQDVCEGYLDKYGYTILDSFFTRFFSGYFFCEKVDLCPNEIFRNYANSDKYAKRIISLKDKKEKKKPVKGGEVLRMLQITDLHLDPHYSANCSVSCKKPICCRNYSDTLITGDLSGKYGYEAKCDAPMDLFKSFVEDAVQRNVDLIIWTGDNAPHDAWVGTQEEIYQMTKDIMNEIDKKFNNGEKKTPVFYSIGNHEKYPNDEYKDNEEELLSNLSEIFKIYINDEEAIETFKNGGYYSKKFKDTKLRFISLNCLVCDSFNFNLFNSTREHAKDMFRWLEKELQKAEQNEEYVYILNHFPLNADFSLTECSKRFQALYDRYEYIVRGIFSGHTHNDDIQGVSEYFNKSKIIHLNFIAPQFTTYSFKIPSYRIYTIDKDTMEIIDYEQFRFDLERSNKEGKPYWYSAYNASSFYEVENMLDYNKILDCKKMEEYVVNKYSGSQEGIKNKNDPDYIRKANCTMHTNNFDEFYKCYSTKFTLSTSIVSVLTNFLIGPFENFDE